MQKLLFILRYLRYRWLAKTKYHIHSPFVYDLLTNIIEDNVPFYIYDSIESIRSQMLLSNEEINVTDFGTGGDTSRARKLKLKYIASHYMKPVKYGQLLFRLVNRFKPSTLLELGTSLGITSMYQAAPNSRSILITLEGCGETAAIAKRNFEKAGIKNISLFTGEFDKTLPQAIFKLQTLDCVFFDGNHREEATMKYFNECLQAAHENSFFIIDDIHWNSGMESAWKAIKKKPEVTTSIDLFYLGLVFFNKAQTKQNFVIKF
jgi:predicted O-methyltransferase YrrM